MRQSRTSIGMKFLLAIGLLLTAFSLLLVYQVWQGSCTNLRQMACGQAELAAAFDQAIRRELSQSPRPSEVDPVVGEIFEQVSRQCPQGIMYAEDARLEAAFVSAKSELENIRSRFARYPAMESLKTRVCIDRQDCAALFFADRSQEKATGRLSLKMIAVPLTAMGSRGITDQMLGRLSILMFALLGLLAAVYASFQVVAGRHLRRFAGHLETAAHQSGSFHFTPLEIHSNDEIGLLADRYNQLGQSLETMYRTLETEVQKRTRELEQANEHLQHKIHECRVAEEQATVLAHEAMAASRAKSEFLANMSHELRTPMNSIVGFSDILEAAELTDEHRGYVKMICSSSHALLTLIQDLLDFSRIEAGKLDILPMEFSIGDMMAEIDSMMRPTAIKKGIAFEILQCDMIGATLRTDRIRLRQCLLNLVSNALKFTESGHVFVNIELEEGSDDNWIRFDVEDTGIGIAPGKLEMIFDSFTQADGAMSRKYGGTGLGLAITQKLAELIDGRLDVTSDEGVGSVFSIRIPACVQVADNDEKVWNKYEAIDTLALEIIDDDNTTQREKGSNMSSGKILVAEDNPSNQKLMTILLQKMGMDVTIADDGQIAIDKCQDESFDLILMDMQMPNVNGYEATRTLRSRGVKTPIIAVTANAMMGDEEKCLEAGCDGYISKPIDRVKLGEVINSHLAVKAG